MTKIAAIYNVWDGDELLPYSIKQIRDHIDLIIIMYQDQSNIGEKYLPDFDYGDINVKFVPDLTKSAHQNEKDKRQLGLEFARRNGCTHFIHIDCDELYDPDDFAWHARRAVQFDASVCRMRTYYKHPDIMLTPIEDYYVPFICRLTPDTKMGGQFPVIVDPTRSVNTHKQMYQIEHPIMHHYSWVRKDIGRKLRNSSAAPNFKGQISQLIEKFNAFEETGELAFFNNHHWVKTGNKFGIDW